MLGALISVHPTFASTTPNLYIDPPVAQTNPTEYLTVYLMVADVVDLYGFQVKITWNTLLTEPIEGKLAVVDEGDFLYGPDYDIPTAGIAFTQDVSGGWVAFTDTIYKDLRSVSTVYGPGFLAAVTFKVKYSGVSPITLFETKMWDIELNLIEHTVTNGEFYTTKPYVTFTVTPSNPLPGETTTFDSAGTFDPDEVTGPYAWTYTWNFGDGTAPATGAVVTHIFASYRYEAYQVTLTVTDDDGETWSATKPVRIWRDVAIVDIWPSIDWFDNVATEYYHGEPNYYDAPMQYMDVLVTVVNYGSQPQTIFVYLYADLDTSVIGDELQIHWFGVAGSSYDHMTWNLAPGRGTGWYGDFMWYLDYHSGAPGVKDIGDYTLTAIVYTLDDQVLSNNEMTYAFPIHIDPAAKIKSINGPDNRFKISAKGDTLTLTTTIQNTEKAGRVEGTVYGMVSFEIMTPEGDLMVLNTPVSGPLTNDQQAVLQAQWTGLTTDDIGTYQCTAILYFGTSPFDLRWQHFETKSFSFTILP